jgi:hypothetical protein
VCGVRNGQGRFGQDSVQKCHYASGTACLPAYQTSVSNYINILLPILFLLGATQTGGWLGLLFGMAGMPPSKLRPASLSAESTGALDSASATVCTRLIRLNFMQNLIRHP